MLMRFKPVVVIGLFALAAVCFILGWFPIVAGAFWAIWILGCASCILGLMAAMFVRDAPRHRDQAPAEPRLEEPRSLGAESTQP